MREVVYLVAGILVFWVGYAAGWRGRAKYRLRKWRDAKIHRPVQDREALK